MLMIKGRIAIYNDSAFLYYSFCNYIEYDRSICINDLDLEKLYKVIDFFSVHVLYFYQTVWDRYSNVQHGVFHVRNG